MNGSSTAPVRVSRSVTSGQLQITAAGCSYASQLVDASFGDQLIAPRGGRRELEAERLAGVRELHGRRRLRSQHRIGAEDDEGRRIIGH